MGKTGRNEPCPCGSGKKYKYCCGASKFEGSNIIPFPGISGFPDEDGYSYQESSGIPDPAFEAFTRELIETVNLEPEDDFLGLSSEMMHKTSTLPLEETPEFLSLRGSITEQDIPSIPVLRQIRWLLNHLLTEGPIKLTTAGYIPPVHAKAWFEDSFKPFTSLITLEFRPVRRESDEPQMLVVRDIMKKLRLTFMRSGKLGISTGGRVFFDISPQEQYYLLFYFLADEWDWARGDWGYFELSPFHQSSLPFYLYALKEQGSEGWDRFDVEGIFTTAFPYILGEIEEGAFFFHVVLREPARYFTEPLGLTLPDIQDKRHVRVVPSDLFFQELQWGDFS
ncbi:MAG: hypothetical protein DRP60_01695 [Spirochaetes bacterium]|nr:MAG: hypothetical protein DRP60_01695 [Spirochaetota bacterium]